MPASRGVEQHLLESSTADRLLQDSQRTGGFGGEFAPFPETGEKEDAAIGIVAQDVATGGQTVQFRHCKIHQDDVGSVLAIGADRIEPGMHDGDHLMFARAHKIGQHARESLFIISDQDAQLAQAFALAGNGNTILAVTPPSAPGPSESCAAPPYRCCSRARTLAIPIPRLLAE